MVRFRLLCGDFFCGFSTNFQESGCILLFQLGSYMKVSFSGSYQSELLHFNYRIVLDAMKGPFSLQLKNANRTNAVSFVTFLLILEKMAIF